MKILCAADLHVGRRPSRLPGHLDTRRFSCVAAWDRVVAFAVENRVDLVAIAGDLVDRDNRFYEAYGPLERGLNTLASSGIDTVAVAGNHDFDVLTRLAEGIRGERFHLLGAGGRWERYTLERDGRTVLHVDGWSFPTEHVRESPLLGYLPPPADGVPVLGLLHADLDQRRSRYAPVMHAALQQHRAALWLLGHIHRPTLRPGGGGAVPVLYPGSPQGMDPGEDGPHGVWIAEIGPSGAVALSHHPLDGVRYASVELDLTGAGDAAEVERRIPEAVMETLATAAPSPHLEYLCCRVRLTGRTRLHRHLQAHLAASIQDLELTHGGVTAGVDRVVVDTRPAVDLDALARGNDPPAVLAGLLLALEGKEERGVPRDLVRRAEDAVIGIQRARPYQPLRAAGPAPEGASGLAREELRRQGWLLLDTLLAQREAE